MFCVGARSLALLRRPVLVELPFTFDADDGNAKGNDLPQHALDEFGRLVVSIGRP